MATAPSRIQSGCRTDPSNWSSSGRTTAWCCSMIRAYCEVPPNRSGSRRASAVNSAARASGVTPGFIRAINPPPKRPGVMSAARTGTGNQSIVPSTGNRKSGPITPMTTRLSPATSYARPEDRRVAPEPGLPEGVAEDHHPGFILRHRQAPEDRRGTECGEEIGGRRRHPDALNPLAGAQGRGKRIEEGGALQELRLLTVLQVELAGHAKFVRHVRTGSGRGDVDQAIGVGVGERPEEDGIDHAEDAHVGADGEPERPDGDGGEPGRAPQRAGRMAEVADPVVDHGESVPRRCGGRSRHDGRAEAFGEGGPEEVDCGCQPIPERRPQAAGARRIVVPRDLLPDFRTELQEEGAGHEGHEAEQGGFTGCPARYPRRTSAIAARCLRRPASPASMPRPARVRA